MPLDAVARGKGLMDVRWRRVTDSGMGERLKRFRTRYEPTATRLLLLGKTADAVATAVDAVRGGLAHEGSIGVVAASEVDAIRLRKALGAAGIAAAGPEELGARVTVLGAGSAKGLEYDHVVVVEPAAIAAAAEARGLHRLYVVLTRAVSRLDVVHERPLPW